MIAQGESLGTRLLSAYSTYYNYAGAEANLAVALYGLSVQDSCLMVFTVHGIVPPSRGTYLIHCKNHETTITYTAQEGFKASSTRVSS